MHSATLPALLLLATACICAATAQHNPFTPPKFCHGLDCPVYTVLATDPKYPNFEIRQYDAAMWSRTNVTDIDFGKALTEGFDVLFRYIDSEKVPMEAPVLVKVVPGQGPTCKSFFQESFYFGYDYQNGNKQAPQPGSKNPNVFIARDPAVVRAVLQFGGRVSKFDDIVGQLQDLLNILHEKNLTPVEGPNVYSFMGYDSPFTIFDRHNEVAFDITYSP
eukprot:EC799191.1.p2 GENE.EC799191.1~~EC799191.1.p2  ORF type:complete len:219 (+),score=83.91 EC799191.1:94-750(+)